MMVAADERRVRCPSCAEEVLAAAKKCKHCGDSIPSSADAQPAHPNPGVAPPEAAAPVLSGPRRVLNVFGAVLILAMVVAWVWLKLDPPDAPSTKHLDDLQLVSAKINRWGSYDKIEGSVKNGGTRSWGYVQIDFNLYDASGAQVGSAMDNVKNVEPGSEWKFSAPVAVNGVTTFKLKSITGD